MALVVEMGTGSATADSYISLVDAATRHTNLGNTAWAALATDAIREQYLRRATEYMEGVYRKRWAGYRKTATQALSWPRTYVYLEPFTNGATGSYPFLVSDTIVPNEVKNACADLALKAATTELAPDISPAVQSESVGPLSVTYASTAREFIKYRAIDQMLAVYLQGNGGASISLIANG